MSTKRALITGINGFVGQRLAVHLKSHDWEVAGMDMTGDDGEAYQKCDLRDADKLMTLLEWADSPTHVFHLAAITFVPDSKKDPTSTHDINVGGTKNLARAMMECCKDARLLFIGSSESYGPPEYLPVDELHPMNPQNPYAESKAAADSYCREASSRGDLDIVRMRPFNHSGPGQTDRFVLSSFARQMAEISIGAREPVLKVGNLEVARDFSHVDDIICGYEGAALKGERGEVYNVCSGRASSLTECIELLRGMLDVDVHVERDEDRYRPAEIPEIRGCHEKLSAATGWESSKTFEDLMRDLFQHWKSELQVGNEKRNG